MWETQVNLLKTIDWKTFEGPPIRALKPLLFTTKIDIKKIIFKN